MKLAEFTFTLVMYDGIEDQDHLEELQEQSYILLEEAKDYLVAQYKRIHPDMLLSIMEHELRDY